MRRDWNATESEAGTERRYQIRGNHRGGARVFLSHFEQPYPTGFHGFVQVPEGTILDHNRLSFLSMDYPFNAKHPVPPLSLTNTGTSRQRERPRTSSADRADAWGSFSHFIYPQNHRLRSRKPAPTACFFHVCRDFRSLRGRQILVRGQLLLHLAAFRCVEPPLYFFVWSGRCARLVWSERCTRASDQERQGGNQRVEERSPD
jgi:hypothetical protein